MCDVSLETCGVCLEKKKTTQALPCCTTRAAPGETPDGLCRECLLQIDRCPFCRATLPMFARLFAVRTSPYEHPLYRHYQVHVLTGERRMFYSLDQPKRLCSFLPLAQPLIAQSAIGPSLLILSCLAAFFEYMLCTSGSAPTDFAAGALLPGLVLCFALDIISSFSQTMLVCVIVNMWGFLSLWALWWTALLSLSVFLFIDVLRWGATYNSPRRWVDTLDYSPSTCELILSFFQ